MKHAVVLKGDDAATHFNLGLALARAGHLEDAKAEMRVAGLLAPRDAEIQYNLGAIYWRQDDFPRAAAKFQRAIEISDEAKKLAIANEEDVMHVAAHNAMTELADRLRFLGWALQPGRSAHGGADAAPRRLPDDERPRLRLGPRA